MLEPATSAVVRQSWQRLRLREAVVSKVFYELMFERRPEFRALFQRGFHEQEKMFAQMMSLIIGALDHEAELRFLLRGLGGRHKAYGVDPTRFGELGEFLLEALHSVGTLSPLETIAWQRVLTEIAQQMTEGARGMDAPTSP